MMFGSKKNLVLMTLLASNLVEQPAPEVEIEQGILSGLISADGSMFEYLGIPYATTDGRFKAPLPPLPWEGTFKAVDEHYHCPQALFFNIGTIGSEDCLKMNIYVPAHGKRPLPVMVFIHGGAFIAGDGGKLMYNPEFLVKRDVIVVTVNYRLGILGFLCLGIKEAPGNAGLKDQVAALTWLQKNIAAFGGDPDNVTLFGHSAGAVSIGILRENVAANGLFHRAIMMSGSELTFFTNLEPVSHATATAKHFGFETKDPKELYKILSQIPLLDLIKLPMSKPILHATLANFMSFPCVEKYIPGEEAIIPDIPFNNLLKNPNPKNIPVMYGLTDKEGLFLVAEDTDEQLRDLNENIHTFSDMQFSSERDAKAMQKEVKKYYFGDKEISRETFANVTDLYGDIYFASPSVLESEILTKMTNTKVYNYYFKYDGGRNLIKYVFKNIRNERGASHGDELLYLFSGYIWPFRINKEDQKIIDWMTTFWTNFAKYGDPTPPFDTELPLKWKPSTKEALNFLTIDSELKMGPYPHPERHQFWKKIYAKYRKTSTLNR